MADTSGSFYGTIGGKRFTFTPPPQHMQRHVQQTATSEMSAYEVMKRAKGMNTLTEELETWPQDAQRLAWALDEAGIGVTFTISKDALYLELDTDDDSVLNLVFDPYKFTHTFLGSTKGDYTIREAIHEYRTKRQSKT